MNGPRPLAIRHPFRVRLLAILVAGEPLVLGQYAAATDASMPSLRYHCDVLADEGALVLSDETATITERGRELHEMAQQPDRRQRDRRRQNRRQD